MNQLANALPLSVDTDEHENASDSDQKVPSFYSHSWNETVTTYTESFSYSEASLDQRQARQKSEKTKRVPGRKVPKATPPLKDISTTPRTTTRKSPLHSKGSVPSSTYGYRSDPISIASSSSDSWDTSHCDASREVSLLDTVDSRDDIESENEGNGYNTDGRDGIDKMLDITLDYQQANNHSFGDDSLSPSFAESNFSLPKLAQGPYSHLRNNTGGSNWLSFYRKEDTKANAEQGTSVTEEQFLSSAERREKLKKMSESLKPDMSRQESFLFNSLRNLLSPLNCGPRQETLKNDVLDE